LGVQALAVPLRDMQGHTVAALNVVLSGTRYQEETLQREMLPLLFEAAREVRSLL
jgi:IclR family pca regulon transcriptional regulator